MPVRNASAVWEGGLKGGNGTFKGTSGAIGGSYSYGSRFEEASGSNPEELLAAALAACFSMAFSGAIERAGGKPHSIETTAACSIDKGDSGFVVTRIRLKTHGNVSDISAEDFAQAADQAKNGCPISKALKGNVQIDLEASLA